jgi:hypothetical protein
MIAKTFTPRKGGKLFVIMESGEARMRQEEASADRAAWATSMSWL